MNKYKDIKAIAIDVDGTLTDSRIGYTESGGLIKFFSVYDGKGIDIAKKAGFGILVISADEGNILNHRMKKLGITDVYYNCHDKVAAVNEYCLANSFEPSNIAFIGDDINDIPVMKYVGISMCVKDAPSEVRRVCKYVTKRKAGYGAVRDAIEKIMKKQKKWFN